MDDKVTARDEACSAGRGRCIDVDGFTMAELLVVIVISMLMTALALPATLKWLNRQQLELTAARVAGDLQRARLEAATERTNVTLEFDATAGEYFGYRDIDGDGNQDSGETTLRSSVSRLPDGIRFAHPTAQPALQIDVGSANCECAEFRPDGTLVPASPVETPHAVYLANRYGDFRRVRILVGGSVRAERWNGMEWQ